MIGRFLVAGKAGAAICCLKFALAIACLPGCAIFESDVTVNEKDVREASAANTNLLRIELDTPARLVIQAGPPGTIHAAVEYVYSGDEEIIRADAPLRTGYFELGGDGVTTLRFSRSPPYAEIVTLPDGEECQVIDFGTSMTAKLLVHAPANIPIEVRCGKVPFVYFDSAIEIEGMTGGVSITTERFTPAAFKNTKGKVHFVYGRPMEEQVAEVGYRPLASPGALEISVERHEGNLEIESFRESEAASCVLIASSADFPEHDLVTLSSIVGSVHLEGVRPENVRVANHHGVLTFESVPPWPIDSQ